MIWTFLLGIIAGWVAPSVEERMRPMLNQYLPGDRVSDTELRAVAICVCLLVAAVVAMLTGSSHVLPLTLGAVLGAIGPRLYDKFREMRAPDYDS
ncbi:MAG: hypothetical protein QNJ20_02940 [Paracoccaceae bacterium]|nr:hypothetical protein [Paracoccaceae bacterium]